LGITGGEKRKQNKICLCSKKSGIESNARREIPRFEAGRWRLGDCAPFLEERFRGEAGGSFSGQKLYWKGERREEKRERVRRSVLEKGDEEGEGRGVAGR